MKKLLFISLVALTFFSCDKAVVLDLEQTKTRVVIEGLVTNVKDYHYVKITRSVDFYQDGVTPRITNAVVTVKDDAGNTYNFIHNPLGKEELKGYYLPTTSFSGVVGREYTLTATVDGVNYTAKEKLLPVTKIDSSAYKINEDEEKDPEVKGRFYEVTMWTKEPQETKDYYLFKFYRNDTLTIKNLSDVYVADDLILGEKINGLASPVFYSLKDTARFEMYSLTRNAYIFYSDFSNLLNSDGGMFSPPPANPRSNISNGALGLFQVSSVSSKAIILK